MYNGTPNKNKEKNRIEKYINTKREKATEDYKEKAKIIADNNGFTENIIYSCRYAPMIFAELSIDNIERLAKDNSIEEISYCSNVIAENITPTNEPNYDYDNYSFSSFFEDCDFEDVSTFMATTEICTLKTTTGLTGENIKIGMIEPAPIHYDNIHLPESRCMSIRTVYHLFSSIENFKHANRVAFLLAGSLGIASEGLLYSIELGNSLENNLLPYIYCVEDLIERKVKVINMSFGCITRNEHSIRFERFTDYIIKNCNVTIVKSAGNKGTENGEAGRITEPGNADNVITVGSCDNMDTTYKYDDKMRYQSSYKEENGCMKPDVVAHDNVYKSSENNSSYNRGGTSFAAPVVTGTIALMLERRPSLALHPEVIKAIVMASCHYKALPSLDGDRELMTEGLSDIQGAGVINYLDVEYYENQ